MHLLFFMRYKSQLRRIRPELVSRLEESITRVCGDSGGNVRQERRLLLVFFDEQKVAARLDMLTALEGILDILKKDALGFYGYSLVVGPMTEEDGYERLGRLLASEGGGIWFGEQARKDMSPYVYFEKDRPLRNAAAPDYVRFKGIKTFDAASEGAFPFRETIVRALRQGGGRNALVLGPPFSGKRDGVFCFAGELFPGIPDADKKDFSPVLVFRFGTGGSGLCPFLDAWSPALRSFLQEGIPGKEMEELDALGGLLFRERLRDEIPGYLHAKGRRFLDLLFELYSGGMKRKGLGPVLVLENLHRAETAAAGIFTEAYRAFSGREDFPAYGTFAAPGGDSGAEEALKPWERVFPRIIRLNAVPSSSPFPDLPPDLLETAYALELFCRCFPGFLLERLFEEGGKSPVTTARAYSLLRHFAVIDTPADPRPRVPDFAAQAESRLGERVETVRALVRERLLDWVAGNKIRPCFRFLEILSALGAGREGDPSFRESRDDLVLKSISADLTSGTDGSLRRALAGGSFEKIAGAERTETLACIAETERALLYGTEADIRNAFAVPPPEPYASYRARMLVNLTAYHLGMRDAASALETVKEAIFLSQSKPWMGLAGAYRLFSLVNLARQRMVETMDYAGFAVENAEKTGSADELGIALYYTAAAQFLYGNISRAERLAVDAAKQAEKTGRPEWADRARFLLGKFHFETGRYRDALDIFEGLLKGNPLPEKERLLAAWAYRSKVYSQSPLIRKPGGVCPDADLFEIEASYLSENYKKTVELCSRFTAPAGQFVFTEQPDWSSGFAQCELLMLLPSEFWNRTVSVYHSLALCRLSRAGAGEAVRNMQRMLRDEGLSDTDPNGAFYLYAFYRILEDSGAPQVDMNTAVSMAFKRLQRRASRIDDTETRGGFLSLPRWNNALSHAARVYKLI
ncbi:MAG: hypothetical protein LBK08_09550 [Treponema sp.]|jgi:tetratricopeptide (TPR) repeat protein|nr:hypothetical protein [Treponema sp.]